VSKPRLLDLFCGAGGSAMGSPIELAWDYLRRVLARDQASPEGKLDMLETAVVCLLELYL
jgi:hypothetical protein